MAGESEFDGFILQKRKALPLSDCAEIVDRVEKALSPETGILEGDNWVYSEGNKQFIQGSLGRNDQQIFLPNYHPMGDLYNGISLCAMDGLKDYCDKFHCLRDSVFSNVTIKLQKTPKGGGYSVWHYERGLRDSHRSLGWMFY